MDAHIHIYIYTCMYIYIYIYMHKNLKRIPTSSTFGGNTTQGVTKCNNKR